MHLEVVTKDSRWFRNDTKGTDSVEMIDAKKNEIPPVKLLFPLGTSGPVDVAVPEVNVDSPV